MRHAILIIGLLAAPALANDESAAYDALRACLAEAKAAGAASFDAALGTCGEAADAAADAHAAVLGRHGHDQDETDRTREKWLEANRDALAAGY